MSTGDTYPVEARLVVPAHESWTVPWRQSYRGGSMEDRTMREVTTSVPPRLSEVSLVVPGEIMVESERAVRTIAQLDNPDAEFLRPLARLLLRAESVASSKIEHEEASVTDFAKALHGVRSNSSATAMVAASDAIERLMLTPVTTEAIAHAHERLMGDEPTEKAHAGRWRTMQNWIGGSDHSPRGALYVPPPHDLVPGLMADLVAFARRRDVPVIAQAAIAHAQFESIHPFTDGNGRIGRALAAAVIRERGVARNIVVPIASALVARREHYFDTLGAYRAGDAGPIVHAFARSAVVAAEESLVTAKRLRELPAQWREAAGNPRSDSGTTELLQSLMATPIFSAETLEQETGLKGVRAYRAIDRLVEHGVLVPLTNRKRDQVWGTAELLAELDDLGTRIARRAEELLHPLAG